MWASAEKIGCAASYFVANMDNSDWNSTLLACNYGRGNLIGAPVYSQGDATSQCKTGKKMNEFFFNIN